MIPFHCGSQFTDMKIYVDGIRDMCEKYQAEIDELNTEIEELRDDVKAEAE